MASQEQTESGKVLGLLAGLRWFARMLVIQTRHGSPKCLVFTRSCVAFVASHTG